MNPKSIKLFLFHHNWLQRKNKWCYVFYVGLELRH